MSAPTSHRRVWRPGRPVDVVATLGVLRHGGSDPAFRVVDHTTWWATRTHGLPTTLCLRVDASAAAVVAEAWGDSADALLDEVPQLLGAQDDPSTFVAHHAVVGRAWRANPGWRVPTTGRVFEALAAAVLEQKVTGGEANRSWRRLLTNHGDRAPGPTPVPMYVPPTPSAWVAVPSWEWHQAGVTPQRRRTLQRAAALGATLERTRELPVEQAETRLRAIPGIGVWTAAEVRQRAFGDPDTVSVGDFHLAHAVCWALSGDEGGRGDDERMLALLEPYCGHRYRVQRLLELTGVHAPRRGPRYAPPAHRLQ